MENKTELEKGKFNTGVPLDAKQILRADKNTQREYAEDFSEGSESLQRLLLSLWERGVRTVGCCAGHEHEDPETNVIPYISFELNRWIPQQMIEFFAALKREFGEKVSITYLSKGIKDTVGIYFSGFASSSKTIMQEREKVFDFINDAIANLQIYAIGYYNTEMKHKLALGLLSVQPNDLTVSRILPNLYTFSVPIFEKTLNDFDLTYEEAKAAFPNKADALKNMEPESEITFNSADGIVLEHEASFE